MADIPAQAAAPTRPHRGRGSRPTGAPTARRKARRGGAARRAMPSSMMRPSSMMISRSMAAMVESRCAMAMTVLPFIRLASCSWIAASTSESSALVASSSTRIGASFSKHARDRDALALTARQLHPPLADVRAVALAPVQVLQAADEIVRVRACGRLRRLRLAGVGTAIEDVVAHRAVQQRGILRHDADLAAQAVLRDVRDVLVVDEDAARSPDRGSARAATRASTCRRPSGRRGRPSRPAPRCSDKFWMTPPGRPSPGFRVCP